MPTETRSSLSGSKSKWRPPDWSVPHVKPLRTTAGKLTACWDPDTSHRDCILFWMLKNRNRIDTPLHPWNPGLLTVLGQWLLLCWQEHLAISTQLVVHHLHLAFGILEHAFAKWTIQVRPTSKSRFYSLPTIEILTKMSSLKLLSSSSD